MCTIITSFSTYRAIFIFPEKMQKYVDVFRFVPIRARQPGTLTERLVARRTLLRIKLELRVGTDRPMLMKYFFLYL